MRMNTLWLSKNLKDAVLILFAICTLLYITYSVFKIITTSAPDFPSYYYATQDLLQHKNPYVDLTIPNKFLYPAATSVIFLPFMLLPYTLAQSSFVILSALIVPCVVAISLQLIYKKISWRKLILFTALAYISFPTKFTLGMGQVNLLALMFLMLGLFYYRKDKSMLSGVFFGLSFLAKPILVFMGLFLLFEKAWRVFGFAISTVTALVLFSFLLYGFESELYYVTSVVPGLIGGVEGREVYYNQGIMGFISRLTENETIIKIISLSVSLLLLLLTSILLVKNKIDTNTKFSILIVLLLILHTLSWQHYFVFFIFPFIFATKIILDKKKYILLYPLAIAYLLISWNFKDPSSLANIPNSLLLSHDLYGAIILLLVILLANKNKHGNYFFKR